MPVFAATCGTANSEESDAFAGAELAELTDKPTFLLTDSATGEPYDFVTETAGRLTLLFFGCTSCPDRCPRMHPMARAARCTRSVPARASRPPG